MANFFSPEALPSCSASNNPSCEDPFRAPTRDCVQRPYRAIMAALNFYGNSPTALRQVFPTIAPMYKSPGMNFPRYNTKVATVGKYVYVVGGRHRQLNDKGDAEIQVNNFFSRINVIKPNNPWEYLKPMHCPRMANGIAVNNDCIFVAGGINIDLPIRHAEYYSILRQQWFEVEPLNLERCFCQLVCCKDEIYILGGSDQRMQALKAVDRLDLNGGEKGVWLSENPMLTERTHFSAVGYGHYIYAIGGYSSERVLNTGELYSAYTKQWTFIPNMILPRFRFSAVVMDNRIHILGGHSSIIATSKSPVTVDVYTVDEAVWQTISELPESYLISDSNNVVVVTPP